MIAPETLLQNRYLVLEQIGHGGMGAVYRATDQRFGSVVALKETFFDDPSLRKAFEREAHLLNRLRHPALPRVSDHFTESAGQFLVMEFIAGEDLSEMLEKRGGAFPVEQVLDWADQLLDALDYLHTHEPPVIHRDIKPQNLKLASRNQIVLLDFGLAKGTPAAALSRASLTGSVFGYSRNYAPLEQMQGTGTDTRSDIYSLAATLYHLLTNTIPPDALTRAMATVNGQPDPLKPANEVHPQVTPSVALALALSRAMAQGPAQRFQTAEDMRAALREAARRIEDERASTVVTPAPAAVAALQDQETQLLGAAQTSARSADATRASEPGATGIAPEDDATRRAFGPASGQEAATLINPALTTPGGARPPAASHDSASVVTRVGLAQPAPRGRGLSGRTLGAAASVTTLLVLAGAFYAYTRRDAAPQNAPAQVQPAPQTSMTPAPHPSAQTIVGDAQPTTPPAAATGVNVTSVQTKQPQPTAPTTAPAKASKRAASRQAGEAEENAEADEEPDVPEVESPPTPEMPRGLSPEEREELRRLPRKMRRMILEQNKANVMRQHALEQERRRRRQQQQPYPPE